MVRTTRCDGNIMKMEGRLVGVGEDDDEMEDDDEQEK